MDKETKTKEEKKQITKPRIPDYKGDGVAVWINKRDNGKEYLNIKIVGHENIYATKQ